MSSSDFTPQIFACDNAADRQALTVLRSSHPALHVVDTLADQFEELAEVNDPSRLGRLAEPVAVKDTDGCWVYYSWRETLVRVLPESDYRKLRSSRNYLLTTPADQAKFARLRIGIAGLNVGNPAALCIALEGGAESMKFADYDTLSVSNLNRFRAGLPDLGLNKATLSARQVYEVNPYAHVDVWEEGIKPGAEDDFLLDPKIDVLIEEMDNVRLKISIREQARKHRIPVVMVTGNGSNVIIDVERYDHDPELPHLNGHLKPEVVERIHAATKDMSVQDKVLLARDFMGKEHLTKELQESFLHVGETLAGIPQLAESSFLRGAAVCYVVRQIATGAPVPSGRYNLNLDEVIPNGH